MLRVPGAIAGRFQALTLVGSRRYRGSVRVGWVRETTSTMASPKAESFDGPMPGHEPGMPVHYDLHAYIWRHNPHGTFTAWNPNVHCR